MSKIPTIYIHEGLNKRVQTYEGFSFPGAFFSPIWCILKGMWLHAVIAWVLSILSFFTFGVTGLICFIVYGLKGNEWHKQMLVNSGYRMMTVS